MKITIEHVLYGLLDFLKSREFRRAALSIGSIVASREISKRTIKDRKPTWAIRSLIDKSNHIDMEFGNNQTMPCEWKGSKEANRIIVYHEADKAGPHIDTYLVIDGKAYSIGVKRLRPEHIQNIKKNGGGLLTEKSKQYIASIIRQEYANGAWLAQTTDHTPEEARTEWSNRAYNGVYGAGEMRQVVLDSPVTVFKTGDSIEFRDWDLNPDTNAYVFNIMDEKPGVRSKRILKLGYKANGEPKLKDRLHLKPHIGTHEFDRFKRLVGNDGIVTLKEDGASFYFEINKEGMRFWSPRKSKVTGHRINYDAKVGNLIHHTSPVKVTGMGELNFIDKKTGIVLDSANTGGILNSHNPLPNNIEPRLTIYRIDSIGRQDVHDIDYSKNLSYIGSFVNSLKDEYIRQPQTVTWDNAQDIAHMNEGLVGIAKGDSILEGRKFKPRHDLYDWTITSIDLQEGSKGRIAGVVRFENESGKQFKIGAGSIGSDEFVKTIMRNPNNFIGRVAKVSSYKGHEGRAPKFVEWHEAKGFA